jgi:hypothetical protein
MAFGFANSIGWLGWPDWDKAIYDIHLHVPGAG